MKSEKEILEKCRVVAVVGLSSKSDKPSNQVASYLKEHGYKVIPVNPMEKEIFGLTCYPELLAIPGSVDVVVIFRRSEDVPPIVEQAIKIGAKVVWMQEGVINEPAAERTRKAGMFVVMDKCIKKEHVKLHENCLP